MVEKTFMSLYYKYLILDDFATEYTHDVFTVVNEYYDPRTEVLERRNRKKIAMKAIFDIINSYDPRMCIIGLEN